MRLFGKYRLGFDIWAIILFLVIMIPNFIWFVVPAPNDVLRGESITGTMDTVASIAQAIMVATLCLYMVLLILFYKNNHLRRY